MDCVLLFVSTLVKAESLERGKKKKPNGREWVTWTKIRELPESEANMSIFYWLIFESDVDTLNTQNIWLLVIVCMYDDF